MGSLPFFRKIIFFIYQLTFISWTLLIDSILYDLKKFVQFIVAYPEFKNQTIEELLETFHIERSLSHKGYPYDNAVAEATFKIIKTEFVWNETFANLSELKLKLWDYVHWYNYHRIHSALGYETPVQYRENNLKKVV